MILSSLTRHSVIKKTLQPGFATGFSKLHVACWFNGTHDYTAVDVLLPSDKHQAATKSKSVMNRARDVSGAVVRWKKVDGDVVVDEDPVLVVGRPFQVKAATDYLLNGNVDNQDEITKADSKLVWNGYKRNFKGQFPPEKARRACIRCGGTRISGNPCPLCQMQIKSQYKVHFTDIEILEQFICPHTWDVLSPKVTGVCHKQQQQLTAAIEKARNFGLLPFTLPLHSKEVEKHKPAGVPTDKKIKVKMH